MPDFAYTVFTLTDVHFPRSIDLLVHLSGRDFAFQEHEEAIKAKRALEAYLAGRQDKSGRISIAGSAPQEIYENQLSFCAEARTAVNGELEAASLEEFNKAPTPAGLAGNGLPPRPHVCDVHGGWTSNCMIGSRLLEKDGKTRLIHRHQMGDHFSLDVNWALGIRFEL